MKNFPEEKLLQITMEVIATVKKETIGSLPSDFGSTAIQTGIYGACLIYLSQADKKKFLKILFNVYISHYDIKIEFSHFLTHVKEDNNNEKLHRIVNVATAIKLASRTLN